MLTTILTDMSNAMATTLRGASTQELAFIIIIAILLGLNLKHVNNLFGRSVSGVLIFGIVSLLASVMRMPDRFSFATWNKIGSQAWRDVITLSLYDILGYVVAFMLLISLVAVIKRFIGR